MAPHLLVPIEHRIYTRVMRYGVGDTALKHGVPYQAVINVARTGDYLGADEDGLIWWIGSDEEGNDLEVAGLTTHDGAIVLIHAMPTKWRKR